MRLFGRLCLILALLLLPAAGGLADPAGHDPAVQGPVTPWPRPVPARVSPPEGDRVVVLTLGPVETPLADAMYDPAADRLTPRGGPAREDYYRRHLKVEFFRPLDKSRFPTPPCGWTSWYRHYQGVNPEKVLSAARWLAENFAGHGVRYVQVDDGWQDKGRGIGDNRDWTVVNRRFSEPGLAGLASAIGDMGFLPGIWLAPHGQSNPREAERAGVFLRNPDGSSASDTWEGKWLVDPTAPGSGRYLESLMAGFKRQGFAFFKIDGQPVVIKEYARLLGRMAGPVPPGPPPQAAARLYRRTLEAIRKGVGPESYLLGCWGIPLDGVGLMNGSRTGRDAIPGWKGFGRALKAVYNWNFLHNIAWYCDPDVLLTRPPQELGLTRAWASLIGLSGQALFLGDAPQELPPGRVDLLRRVTPPMDVRPLDLFRPKAPPKPIWDLKIARAYPPAGKGGAPLSRSYDVAGVFNFSSEAARCFLLTWRELGLKPEQPHHVYDFWQNTYLGAWPQGVFVWVPPRSVRVLTIVPAADHPLLISSNRHITQGYAEITALSGRTGENSYVISGESRPPSGPEYALTLALPPGWQAVGARVESPGGRPLAAGLRRAPGYCVLSWPGGGAARWQVEFKPGAARSPAPKPPGLGKMVDRERGRALAQWNPPYQGAAAYAVSLNGSLLGYSFQPRVMLQNLASGREHEVTVRAMGIDGAASRGQAALRFQGAPRPGR